MNVFVYGTLRPGASRWAAIEARVTAQAEAWLEGRLFVLADGNPILVESSEAAMVRGDLLVLPDSPAVLTELDRLEGVVDPRSPYQRVERQVQSVRGDDLAFVYVCKPDVAYQVLADGHEVAEGDWFYYAPRG